MAHRRLGIWVAILSSSVVAAAVAVVPAAGAPSAGGGYTRQVAAAGTTSYSPTASDTAGGVQQPEVGPGFADGAGNASSHNSNGVNRSRSIEHTAPSVPMAPVAPGVGVSSSGLPVLSSFDGLNHFQQRHANGGNQFSVEPPDQGLCAGNGFVVEAVNDVIRVYAPSGAPMNGVEDLNTFFGYPAAINRHTGARGQFVTDPSCYYDSDTNRWFVDVLTLDTFSSSGDFTGANHLDIAVSTSGDPTGSYVIYRTQVQDDGNNGTPNHGCTGIAPYGQTTVPTFVNACLGDYPHLGADANGLFITTNEYSFFGNDFHGSQIYAFSKSQLAANAATVNVTQFDTHGMDNGNSGFTIWPATAPHDLNSSANGGTEYFMSSNAADETHGNGSSIGPRQSNQLLVWSVTDTSAIDTMPSDLSLSHGSLGVGPYVVPARSEQKAGSTPLIDCLNKKSCAVNFLLGARDPFAPEHEYPLDSNDTRMQQVVFADGMLWGALDTAVNSSANTRAGIEWFVVNPTGGSAKLVNSGYLAVSQENVTYPAIAVTPSGQGVIAFTLLGRDFFPSAAFASINAGGTGAVQLAAQGLGPADGFSGTAVFNAPNPPRPRWGDYGAAVVDGSNIWVASEYIGQTCDLATYIATGAACGNTRTSIANWDTRVTEVNPAG